MLKKSWLIRLGAALMLASLVMLYALGRTVSVTVDGQAQSLHTRALTVGGLLRQAGIPVGAQDDLTPPASALLLGNKPITLVHARAAQIWVTPGDERIDLLTTAQTASQMLAEAGLTLAPADRLLLNGQPITPDAALPFPSLLIQVRRAVQVSLLEDGAPRELQSSADTLGEALAEAGIYLHAADRLTPPASTPLDGDLSAELRRAQALTIQVQGQALSAFSSAETVGAALAEAGIALQGMDYSQPAEDVPLPADGNIRVVRVREEVSVTQSYLPFGKQYVQDPNTELDQTSVISAGSAGILLSRERVRYEDGVEVSRQAEAQWQVRAPEDAQVGYGTQVVIKTLDTEYGPVEYWRAVTVYITSYSPCNVGTPGKCSYVSRSGMPVQHGLIAVSVPWYSWMAGQRLYVPGYGVGTVGDTGPGMGDGRYWIDVAYSDADYVGWHYTKTIYFLTPVPDNIPWILP